MMHITLPARTVSVGSNVWTPVKIMREIVMLVPLWKDGMNISKVNAALEIEDALDKLSGEPQIMKITSEAWTFLKEAMQFQNVNIIMDAGINRLYMRVYQAVLAATIQND